MAKDVQRELRYNVAVDASVRHGTAGHRWVKVTNLSATGCRFVSPARRLGMGASVTLSFGRAGLVEAKVRWRLGDTHGLRFDRPIQRAVLDHIRLYLSEEPALVAERVAVTA